MSMLGSLAMQLGREDCSEEALPQEYWLKHVCARTKVLLHSLVLTFSDNDVLECPLVLAAVVESGV